MVNSNIFRNIARQIISTCLKVKRGDMVTINSWHHMMNLAEELALISYQVGAIPIITYMSDRIWYEIMNELDQQTLSQTPKHLLKMVEGETICINIHGPEDPLSTRKLKSDNLKAIRKAYQPIIDKERDLRVKVADIYLGKVTKKRAKIYGLDYDWWFQMILNSLMVDYNEIKTLGYRIAEIISRGKRLEIIAEDTYLTADIGDRPIYIDDGVIDEKDIKDGRTTTMLPTGKLEFAPIEISVEGSVKFDLPILALGKKINALSWEIRRGKLVKFNAEENLDIFKSIYESMTGDKSMIGRIIIGLNPGIEPDGVFDSLIQGAVSIGIGYNMDIGGKNKGNSYYFGTLSKPTINIDGETIISNGKMFLCSILNDLKKY